MTRNPVLRMGTLTVLTAILAACAGSGSADTTQTTNTTPDTTSATTAPAETTSTPEAPETTGSPETTAASGSDTTIEPGAPQLLYDGASVTADHEACSGADGAVVFRSDDDSTMVGFEDGIFLRYIAPDGTVTDTADVTVTETDSGTTYEDDLPIEGGAATVTIVLPADMTDLPECTFE